MPRPSVCLLLLTVACTSGDAAANTATVRDSAGVQIVESTDPLWSNGTGLTLAAEPEVAIGELDGPPEYQLYQVRAATRLSDGTLALFDGGSAEVRYYDAQGRFVRKAGGKGGGPGEYQYVSWMKRLPGDSLMLNDTQAQRITVLAPDGSVARSINMAAAAPPPPTPAGAGRQERIVVSGFGRYSVVGPLADGSLLATARDAGPPFGAPGIAVQRDSVVYVRLDTLAHCSTRSAPSSATSRWRAPAARRSPDGDGGSAAVRAQLPRRDRRRGFWFGSSDRTNFGRYAADGRLQRLIRRPVSPPAITPAIIDAVREQRCSQRHQWRHTG